MEEILNLITDYEAERKYARNQAEAAFEKGDEKKGEAYEIIELAFSDLAYKLTNLLKN